MSPQAVGHRTRGTMLAAVLAGVAIAVTALPAAAGGWWTYPQLEHRTLAIGEDTTVSADVLFASVEAAEAATGSGEYFAYLVRGIDEAGLQEAMSTPGPHSDWWSVPDEIIQLAPLTFDRDSSNVGGATATFTVPEVERGIYDVMLCDQGCTHPLADVVPLRGVYVGDPGTVRHLRAAGPETQQLLDQYGSVRSQVDHLEEQTGTLGDDVDDLEQRLDGLTTADQRFAASLATLEARIAEEEPGAPQSSWWAHAGWFVAGAALAFAWTGRRHAASADGDGEAGEGDVRRHADGGDAESPPPDLVTFESEEDRGGAPVR